MMSKGGVKQRSGEENRTQIIRQQTTSASSRERGWIFQWRLDKKKENSLNEHTPSESTPGQEAVTEGRPRVTRCTEVSTGTVPGAGSQGTSTPPPQGVYKKTRQRNTMKQTRKKTRHLATHEGAPCDRGHPSREKSMSVCRQSMHEKPAAREHVTSIHCTLSSRGHPLHTNMQKQLFLRS